MSAKEAIISLVQIAEGNLRELDRLTNAAAEIVRGQAQRPDKPEPIGGSTDKQAETATLA